MTTYSWFIKIVLPGEGVFETNGISRSPMPVSGGGLRQSIVEDIAANERCSPDAIVVDFSYTALPTLTAPDAN